MALAALILPLADDPTERLRHAGMVRRARYIGFLRDREHEVWACTPYGLMRLRPRGELISVSPIAFGWGDSYAGSLHTAAAVLSHWTGGDEFAMRYYRRFSDEVIRRLHYPGWELSTSAIAHAIARISIAQKNQLVTE
jgi:Family of unknown function (DUF6166)